MRRLKLGKVEGPEVDIEKLSPVGDRKGIYLTLEL